MRIDIITLFPQMFAGPLSESILQRAQQNGLLSVHFHDLRRFGLGSYNQVDDKPYGGGAGMVMRVEPIVSAIEEVMKIGEGVGLKNPERIYFSPRGERLAQPIAEELSQREWLILLCGRYEGIDQRIIDGGWIDRELSIGDYVLTGGELPAAVLTDAVARLLPGVLGDDESSKDESFSASLDRKREYPHYTRPEEFRGLRVPDVLINGHHKKIEEWRREQLR